MLKCEKCDQDHNGNYGSGRFCSQKCAKSFSTYSKRLEINEKVSKTMKGKKYGPGAWTKVKRRRKGNKISLSSGNKHSTYSYFKKKNKEVMEKVPFEKWSPTLIKNFLFREHNNTCEKCGFYYKDSTTGKGPFQIHHKDGNNENWKKENLEFLCLNCHWKTPNFAFKNRKHSRKTKLIMSKKTKENHAHMSFQKKYNTYL